MPGDRALRKAAQEFRDTLNKLLNTTITYRTLSVSIAGDRAILTFRGPSGSSTPAELRTAYGVMGLYIGQVCVLRPADETGPNLQTVIYRYALHNGTDPDSGQIIRWEYDRRPKPKRGATEPPTWCRRHFQGPVALPMGDRQIPPDDMHLPTGYVPLEDVIRYCIVDLDVKLLDQNWDQILTDSYREFRRTLLELPASPPSAARRGKTRTR